MSTKDDELTAEQIWNQEAELRDGTTAQAAEPEAKEPVQDEPDAVVEDAAAPTDAEPPQQTGQEAPDQFKIVLEKLEKIEARTRNVEGHIGGLKAQQQQLHQAMESAKSAAPGNAPDKGDMAEAVKNPEKWEELKKDFPDWADATEELLKSRLSGVKPVAGLTKEELDQARQADMQSMRNELVDTTLNLVLPGWKKEVNTDDFKSWMGSQPDDVKALAQSSEIADAARMLRLYDSFKNSAVSERLKTERQQKLAQGAPLPRGSTPAKTKSINDMTPEELWNYEAKQREKARASRGF